MARPLRIQFEGAIYHITSRGNARQEIFLDDADRRAFLEALAEAVDRFGWICHAYCLMPNHYHLLIETPEPNLSRGCSSSMACSHSDSIVTTSGWGMFCRVDTRRSLWSARHTCWNWRGMSF